MPPLTPGASVRPELGIPAFVIALVGCYAAFAIITIVVVLCLIIIENGCAPRFPPFDRQGPSPCAHQHYLPFARRGLALPVASIRMCLKCHAAYVKADKAMPILQRSVHSPVSPSSYYARRAPTGVRQVTVQPPCGRVAPSTASASTTPTAPLSPPLGPRARGPTASLRPAVW